MLYLVYGHEGGAVIVAGELGVLDEGILLDELLEFFTGDKVVVFAILFTGTRGASSVCGSLMGGMEDMGDVREDVKNTKGRRNLENKGGGDN